MTNPLPDNLRELVNRLVNERYGKAKYPLTPHSRHIEESEVLAWLRALANLPDVRLVPIEATEGMIEACPSSAPGDASDFNRAKWDAMLAHPDADLLAPLRQKNG